MSNAFLARFSAIADRAFKRAGLADDATYKQTPASGPVACVVYLTRDIQQVGDGSTVSDVITTLRVSSTSIGRPKSAASTFIIGSETFVVETVVSADEGEFLCTVTPRT